MNVGVDRNDHQISTSLGVAEKGAVHRSSQSSCEMAQLVLTGSVQELSVAGRVARVRRSQVAGRRAAGYNETIAKRKVVGLRARHVNCEFMLGLLNWPVILAAALLAAVALYVRRPGFLRVSLMIVLIGHADVAAKSIIIFTRNAAALFHLTLPNNWHSGLRLRSIVDLALVAVLLFLGFGFQPASQFLLPRWRHARRFLLVKTGSQPATALCLAALAVGFCLAISAAFLLLIAIAFLVLPYAASPAFCTFLVFGSLLIWRRFPSKAVFGASIAFAISLIATWFFGRYPALESCGYILTVGVDCIVYGVFFFPADSEVDWSKRPG